MNETALTQKLIMWTLRAGGPQLTSRFVRRVVGIEIAPTGATYEYRTEALWEDFGHEAVIVVGISPAPGLSSDDRRLAPGSRVDAVIAGDIAVAFEFKVSGRCQQLQLLRHARHWAIECADDALSDTEALPDGFALRGWNDVWRWLIDELDEAAGTPRELALLGDLRSTLLTMEDQLGLTRPRHLPAAPAVPARVSHPRPTPSREMTQGYDLAAVHRAVSRLYGEQGGHHVSESGCKADVVSMRAAFEQAEVDVPRGLKGDAMTPRRVLSALYSGKALRNAAPAAWTDLRMRVLERGGDRATLVAMIAWAAAHPDRAESRRIYRTTARIWNETPSKLPGMPELHAALDQTRT